MVQEKVKCPYCKTTLNQWAETPKGMPVYECGNCFLQSGTISQMVVSARLRNEHMENQAPRFECTECHKSFPVFRHYKYLYENIEGMLTLRHVCPDCEIALKEKKK